ncbi:MAG: signal peptidase I [Candidatus Blackburnbacteria bacterium]|nr:signal peptidase I [Candidatus Blackburnbacteria bacterium]
MKFFARSIGALFLDTLQTVVLAAAIFMLTYLFLVQPHEVKGNSMHPNFLDGERLLTDKASYRFNEPRRGDVIVFQAPPDHAKDFIKRIIALPGETISIKGKKIYVNARLLDEFYLPSLATTEPGAFLTDGKELILAEDEYIVMGDNRDHSSDSRSWGPIKRGAIVGKAWFIYWPPQDMGVIPTVTYAGF